jgi:homoserine dehydrogenase
MTASTGLKVRPLPTAPPRSPARIALLGCGTVGREVAARLVEEGERLGVSLIKVLVRDRTRDRGIDPGLLTDRFEDVLDAEPDLVIEAIGGVEPAAGYVERALRAGVRVVTANKSLIAHRGESLERTARRSPARRRCARACPCSPRCAT